MRNHPNATVAVGVGTITTIITGTADVFFSFAIPAYLASAYATLLIAGFLFFGRRKRRARAVR